MWGPPLFPRHRLSLGTGRHSAIRSQYFKEPGGSGLSFVRSLSLESSLARLNLEGSAWSPSKQSSTNHQDARASPPGQSGMLWGAYHLRRKTGISGWKIKWYAPFRSELSGKSGRSCEAIHISRSFRFSRSVCEPFQLPALFKIFLARQNKMADHGGNEGEFENC